MIFYLATRQFVLDFYGMNLGIDIQTCGGPIELDTFLEILTGEPEHSQFVEAGRRVQILPWSDIPF